jgi:hypothetical protein
MRMKNQKAGKMKGFAQKPKELPAQTDTRLRAWLAGNAAGAKDPKDITKQEGPGNQQNPPASLPSEESDNEDSDSEESDTDTEEDDNEDDVNEMNSPTPEQLLALIGHPLLQDNNTATPQMDYSYSINTPTPDSNMPAGLRSVLKKGFVLNPSRKPRWRIRNYEKGLYQFPGEAQSMVSALLRDNVIEPCLKPKCISPITFIRKANGKPRLIHDLRLLNDTLRDKRCYFPKLNSIKEIAVKYKFFAKVDLANGYLHIPIRSSSRPYLAFNFEGKCYQFLH